MKSQSLLCFLGIVILSLPVAAGGPWSQPAGKTYLQLSYSYLPAYRSLYLEDGGTLNSSSTWTDRTLALYIERGLGENLTITANAPLKMLSRKFRVLPDPPDVLRGDDVNKFGNVSVGVKYQLSSGNPLFAGGIKVQSPGSEGKEFASMGLRTGIKAWGVTPFLSAGISVKNFYGFADGAVELNFGGYSDNFLLNAEAGYTLFKKLIIAAVLDLRLRIAKGQGPLIPQTDEGGLYPDNQAFKAYGFKLIYQISNLVGINYARFGAFNGHLVARAASNTLGIYLSL